MSDDERKSQLVNPVGGTNLITDAMNNLTAEQLAAVREKAVGEALRLQTKQAEQDIDYVASQREMREHVRTWDALDKSGNSSHKNTTKIKTATGSTTIESRSGSAVDLI